ncbi:MAG: nucleotidyltransferase domain-containing protein [Candidatus Nanoarchaeia archaeon]|nr:nucleotidyltransferase domain-containing protein [Candidatus Nanoarchaeia archaeon]
MSKEEIILELFLNEPAKQWHFEEILQKAKISRPQAMLWLRKFAGGKLIKRIKPKTRMPYYIANHESEDYRVKKRIFALQTMAKAGFLQHLASLEKAKAVILFGSMSRWDWYSKSDIDLFIFGNPGKIDVGKYRKKLRREIQTFICKDKGELSKMNPALLKNITEGYMIKGSMDFVEVRANA